MTGNKGIVLFMVLGTILVIVILANVILGIITNQSRITHHQVSRIQAFYAAQAGVNYAREMIRTNNPAWAPVPAIPPATSAPIAARLCRDGSDCGGVISGPLVIDSKLPASVRWVDISVGDLNSGISGSRKIKATANFTPKS